MNGSEGPHGVSLPRCAAIAAELAEGSEASARVLARNGLSPAQWDEVSTHWSSRIAEEAFSEEETPMAVAYNDAFVAAQDAAKPVLQMSVAEWARLDVDVGRNPSELRERGISVADMMRLRRFWARAMRADRSLAKAYAEAVHIASTGPL